MILLARHFCQLARLNERMYTLFNIPRDLLNPQNVLGILDANQEMPTVTSNGSGFLPINCSSNGETKEPSPRLKASKDVAHGYE